MDPFATRLLALSKGSGDLQEDAMRVYRKDEILQLKIDVRTETIVWIVRKQSGLTGSVSANHYILLDIIYAAL